MTERVLTCSECIQANNMPVYACASKYETLAHKQALCNSSLDMQEEHVAFYTFSWKLHGWFQVYDSNSFSIFCSCSHSVPCQLPTPLLHAPPSRRCTSCGKTASSRGTQCRWLRKVAEPSVARSCLLWVNGTFGGKIISREHRSQLAFFIRSLCIKCR